MFSLRPMTQADAEAIALWHYPEPYSFYDWVEDRDDLDELVDPARRGEAYVSVDDPDGTLIGYFSFKQTARRNRRAITGTSGPGSYGSVSTTTRRTAGSGSSSR